MNKIQYPTKSHEDLIVWQKSMELCTVVYELTNNFSDSEKYGLISQMRRCAVSISSNIAEGRRRGTKLDYQRFLRMSFGSGAELETQLELSMRLGFVLDNDFMKASGLLTEVMKILNVMIRKLAIA